MWWPFYGYCKTQFVHFVFFSAFSVSKLCFWIFNLPMSFVKSWRQLPSSFILFYLICRLLLKEKVYLLSKLKKWKQVDHQKKWFWIHMNLINKLTLRMQTIDLVRNLFTAGVFSWCASFRSTLLSFYAFAWQSSCHVLVAGSFQIFRV